MGKCVARTACQVTFGSKNEGLQGLIDCHIRDILISNIEVFLNHSLRFYERQFLTREEVNKYILVRFEELLHAYFNSDKPEQYGEFHL